jgi:peptidoglycan/xylan/chitin deacetylase (PgdA/CDA1 family)
MLIFNFHHVEKHIFHPERKHITMSPEGLSRFIRTLRLLGMSIVSMRDVLNSPNPVGLQGNRQVLLTFDDGYVNNLTEALPVLEQEQCPATVFVLPGRFSGTNEWDQGSLPESRRDPLMSLEQMHLLTKSPYVTLGSHGMRHRNMTKLPDDENRYEIHESYRILSAEFGEAFLPVFAYPWGACNSRVVDLMGESPYQYAFTVETAPWHSHAHRFQVPRYSAYYRDGNPAVFLAKLLRHKLLFA